MPLSMQNFIDKYATKKDRPQTAQPRTESRTPSMEDFISRYATGGTEQKNSTAPSMEEFISRYSTEKITRHDDAPTATPATTVTPAQSGEEIYAQRQAQRTEASNTLFNRWVSLLGTAATQAQRGVTGTTASVDQQLDEARRQAENASEIRRASEQYNAAGKAIDWDGREELVKEYQNLRAQGILDPLSVDVKRMEEVKQQIEEGDLAAGNGARDYTFLDTMEDVQRTVDRRLGEAGTNLFSNVGQLALKAGREQAAQDYANSMMAMHPFRDNTEDISRTQAEIRSTPEAETQFFSRVDAVADQLGEDATQAIQRAKEGKSALGSVGIDVAENVMEMGFDAAVAGLTGGSALVPMFLRVYGQSVGTARQAGATLEQQAGYALTSAGIEVATEIMFDGVARIYGAGAADEVTEALIGRLAETDTGRTFLRMLVGSVGEGAEEVVSDMLAPLAESIYKDESVGELYSQLDLSEILYDFFIGATVGLMGSGTSLVNGQNAQANAELRMRNAGVGSVSNQADAAWDVLTGRVSAEEQQARAERELAGLDMTQEQQRAAVDENRYVAPNRVSFEDAARVIDSAEQKLADAGVEDERLTDAIAAVALQEKAERTDAVGNRAPTRRQQRMVEQNETARRIVEEIAQEGREAEQTAKATWNDVRSKTTVEGKEAQIVGVQDGQVRVKQDGEVRNVNIDEVKGMTPAYRKLVERAAGQQNGSVMLRMYEPGQDIEAYAKAWDEAENTFGALTNISLEEARGRYALSALTDGQLKMALELGRERYDASQQTVQEQASQRRAVTEEARKKGVVQRKKGSVNYGGAEINGQKFKAVDRSKLSRPQKKLTAMVEALADAVSLDFIVTEGEANTGGCYIKGGTVVVNINSGALSGKMLGAATLSHELTHHLQDFAPEQYQELKEFIIDHILRKSPAQFEQMVKRQQALEPNLSTEAATDEVIANACQTMLLNSKAVEQLARQNMNLAERIAEWISETADKIKAAFEDVDLNDNISIYEPARAIADVMDEVQALWDKALLAADENYNAEAATGKKNTAENGGKQYMAWDSYTEHEIENWKSSKKIVIYQNDAQLLQFIRDARAGKLGAKKMYFGKVSRQLASRIKTETGVETQGFNITLAADEINKIFKDHGDVSKEENRGQRAITENDFSDIPTVISEADTIKRSPKDWNGKPVIDFKKEIAGTRTVTAYVSDKKSLDLRVQTMFAGKNKSLATPIGVQAPINTPEANSGTALNSSIANANGKSNSQNQMFDSSGKEMTDGQQEYFADSKIRDREGRLKVMYRGGASDITVFDRRKSSYSNLYGRGFYFTDSESHASQYGKAHPYYLNITNPLQAGAKTFTNKQIRAFLEAVAEDEDYGLENYGYGATVSSVLKGLKGKDDFGVLSDINATCIGDLVAASELFNEVNGTNIDGIVTPTETVAFRSDQIKGIDNENPTSNPDTRFQMFENTEETDKLVAVHNKSVSGLRRMLQRGGVPFPSIAIKKAGAPHEGFGDISIVFPRSTIDPQVNRQNRLYSNDAWTPTEPRTEYEVVDTWKLRQQMEEELGTDAFRATQLGSYLEENQLARDLETSEGDIVRALKGRTGIKYAYLKSIGQEPEAARKEKPLDGFGRYKNAQLLAVFENIPAAELKAMNYDSTETLQKVADVLQQQFMDSLPSDAAKRFAERRAIYTAGKINPQIIKDALRNYEASGGVMESEIDDVELNRALRDNKAIEEDPQYQEWIRNRFGNLIKDSGIPNGKGIYTDTGNRRSFKARHVPATLENIVAQMRKEQETGIGLGGINLRGAATKAYSSIEEMRQESGKLLGEHVFDEEYDSYMKEFGQRLNDLTETATKVGYDVAKQTLLEAVRDSKNKADMKRRLQNESRWIRYSDELTDDLWQLKQDVQNMPAPYFEAKPRRIVYPEEALAYILPDNADADVLQALEQRGYNVLTYKAGDNADRLEKLNSVEGAQFQRWGIGETEAEQQARAESFESIKAQNKILKARADYWRGQTRRTRENTVRQQDTDRMANELLRQYASRADKAEVKDALKELGNWLVQNSGESLDYDELYSRARHIAEDVIDGNYTLLDDSRKEDLNRLKDYLKSTALNLSASDFRDTGDEGWRRRYGRYFTVSESGRTIDSAWGELAGMFGEGVFPEDVYAPGDMLNMIGDYLDLWRPQYGNEFEQNRGEAVEWATGEIIDRVLSEEVRQTPGTYADRAQQKLNAQIAKDKARLDALREQKNARIEQIRREAAEKISSVRTAEKAAKYESVSRVKRHYRDMMQQQRARRSDTAVRSKIKKLHKELSDMLLHPKEKRYVPRELVKATAEILGAINTTTGGETKASAAFAELKVKYDALRGERDGAMVYDETVSDMLQTLAGEVGSGTIYDLHGEALEAVYNTLHALKHTIQTANRLTASEIEATAFEAANAMMNEASSAKPIDMKIARKWIFTQATPESMFRMLGNYRKNSMWGQMFHMLNQGQLKQTQILMEGGNIFRELIDDKRLKTLHDQKNLVDIGLKDADGNAVKITRGMMLSVYMHLLNEENARHVAYGGFTVPRLKPYYQNKIADAFSMDTARTVTAAEEIAEINRQLREAETQEEKDALNERLDEIRAETDATMSALRSAIEQELTDYDRAWIRQAQYFFDEYSKNKLNEATREVYGFDKAQVDHYFPIHTDAKYRQASFDTITRDMSLENAGFMKERQHGSNPILLEDITDVINSQLQKTAQYAGLMPAVRNFNKVYGKARAGYENSVQAAVGKRFGDEGLKYIENLMADLNGARHGESNIFDQLRGKMAGAALSINLRVTLSQTASWPTAAAEIGYRPLTKALVDMKNPMWDKGLREEIAKWTPLWWYRMQGFSMTELGDIKNSEQFMGKVNNWLKWLTGWIQFADGLTTGGLWQASKYYVDENFSDLRRGSDEYMMKVAEVYNRVIERTQPDYTTLQRPDILRNPNAVVKQLTMFLTQRLQNTNLVYDAARQYAQFIRDAETGRDGVTREDVKTAKTRLLWAVSSQVVASATIVTFKAIADIIMHSMNAYRDDDDELTKESVTKQLLRNFIETVTSNVLWGSEVYSALRSAISGERYYGISLNGVESFTDAVSAAVTFAQKIGKGDKEKLGKAALSLAKSGGQFFGVPVNNMLKWGQMVVNHAQDLKQGTFMEAGVDWLSDSKAAAWKESVAPVGITQHEFARMLKAMNADGNSRVSQDEAGSWLKAEMAAGRLTREQAAGIWSAATDGKKTLDEWLEKNGGSSADRYGRGNIDLTDRNTGLYDEDGRLMTVRSISFEEDGQEILIPTIVKKNGKWTELTDDEAIDWYHRTGEYLGKFDSVAEADAYAEQLHRDQERMYR